MFLEFNFVLVSFGIWTNATQPKTHKWFMKFFYPHQTYSNVMWEIALVRIQFGIYVVVATPFTSNLWSSFICCNIHHTFSTNAQFFILLTPFCYNVYGVVVCFTMPFSLQNALNFLELYSPPSSHIITLYIYILSNFLANLENFKLLKHANFNFHGLKKCLSKKIINES
jgi:hypothetical protein